MNHRDLISTDNIILNSKLNSKREIVDKLSDLLLASEVITDKQKFIKAIYERESRGFTFGGDYLAIPHGFSSCVVSPAIAIARLENPFIWDENGNLVKLIIMFAIPEDVESVKESESLKKIASSLGDIELIEKLLKVNTKEEMTKLIYSYSDRE